MQRLKEQLFVLNEASRLLGEESAREQRMLDDRAGFDVAQAVMARADFVFNTPDLYFDGGNFFRLEDGRCLTTKKLFERNRGRESSLSETLTKYYGCRHDVIYLEALPGSGVIEHVDMFLLPVSRNRLLLASYALDQVHVREAWSRMSSLEREMTFQAALAMERNAALLQENGFEVLRVPALTPRTSREDRLYYPSVLNATVRINAAGGTQVLLPAYAGHQEAVQDVAQEIIQRAFGEGAVIVPIESTAAAEGQGAVHCLTITVPYEPSIFNRSTETHTYKVLSAQLQEYDTDLVASRLSRLLLPGDWRASRLLAGGERIDLHVAFGEEEVTFHQNGRESGGAYTVRKDAAIKWSIEIAFDGGSRRLSGTLEWLANHSLRLALRGMESLILHRTANLEDLLTDGRLLDGLAEANGLLGPDDLKDRDGKTVQAWALEASAGQRLMIHLSSEAFDPELLVIGPGLEGPLHNDDVAQGSLDAGLAVSFPVDGTYHLIVRSYESDGRGAFRITTAPAMPEVPMSSPSELIPAALITPDEVYLATLEELAPVDMAPIAVEDVKVDELTADSMRTADGNFMAAFLFSGCAAGERIQIDLQSEDFDPYLVVGTGRADTVANDDVAMSNLDSRLAYECPDSGFIKILAVALFGDTGEFTLAVRKVVQ